MPAYFAPGITCDGPARNMECFARLRAGDKWQACSSNQNGRQGALCWIGEAPPLNAIGWVDCSDGLFYLPGHRMPSQSELGRPHKVDGIDYTTSTGVTLTVPIATSSPRKVLFSAGKPGDPATDFARRAFKLFDRIEAKEKVGLYDPELLALVSDSIGFVYYTTPEMLDELGWITSADLDPIIMCLMGSDPKKAQEPAGASSPSPAGA